MKNSNNWYTLRDVMKIFGYKHKSSARWVKDNVRTIKVSVRTLYNREDVKEAFISKRAGPKAFGIAVEGIKDFNIDLDLWIPLSEVKNIYAVSRERIYQISAVRGSDKVQAKKFDGFWLFNKEDLEAHFNKIKQTKENTEENIETGSKDKGE